MGILKKKNFQNEIPQKIKTKKDTHYLLRTFRMVPTSIAVHELLHRHPRTARPIHSPTDPQESLCDVQGATPMKDTETKACSRPPAPMSGPCRCPG